MTSRSKPVKACGVQSEGENIDEISISMPSYFPSQQKCAWAHFQTAHRNGLFNRSTYCPLDAVRSYLEN